MHNGGAMQTRPHLTRTRLMDAQASCCLSLHEQDFYSLKLLVSTVERIAPSALHCF
jgi:hypothetical protein